MERIASKASAMLSDILSFWKSLRDDDFGGYYGYMGQDLQINRQAEKGCILNSRILWFFSEAARLTGRQDLREEADHAYEFLTSYCLDDVHGGVFWSVTYDGQVADDTKHTYNQAFAIYALSSYYLLTGNRRALEQAYKIFNIIESTCSDAEGYLEAFTRNWVPESNDKLSENGVLADKTMNTLLHVFEGYSNLYRCEYAPVVGTAMRRCLEIYQSRIYDPALRQLRVFFDAHYHSILDLCSYGHDIEASWLFDAGTQLLDDAALTEPIAGINAELAEAVYERAYRDHSVVNECENGKVDETRVWWVQAEAVLGFLNEWQKSGEMKYRDAVAGILDYIQEKIVDERQGSDWFWSVDRAGNPIPGKPIVDPWKCPYHSGRMCIELIRRDPEIYV